MQIKIVFKLFIYLLNVLLEAFVEYCSLNCDLNESSQQEKSITFYVGERRKKYEREKPCRSAERERLPMCNDETNLTTATNKCRKATI